MNKNNTLISEIDNSTKYKNKEDGYNMDKDLFEALENSYIKHTKKKVASSSK